MASPAELLGEPPEPEPIEPEPEKRRGPGRPKGSKTKTGSAGRQAELNAKLREAIDEIGRWVSERDPELGEVLVEDGPKMADLLSRLAVNPKAPEPIVGAVKVVATALEPIRAFGRIVRVLLTRALTRRRERIEAEPIEPFLVEPEPVVVDDVAPPAADGVTPNRFSVDYEPEPEP